MSRSSRITVPAMRLHLIYLFTLAYSTLIVAWICYAGYCRWPLWG